MSGLSPSAASEEPINWTATESVAWLELSATEGTTPAEVTVTVDLAELSLGVYTATIEIATVENVQVAGGMEVGAVQSVQVTVTVTPDLLFLPLAVDQSP